MTKKIKHYHYDLFYKDEETGRMYYSKNNKEMNKVKEISHIKCICGDHLKLLEHNPSQTAIITSICETCGRIFEYSVLSGCAYFYPDRNNKFDMINNEDLILDKYKLPIDIKESSPFYKYFHSYELSVDDLKDLLSS